MITKERFKEISAAKKVLCNYCGICECDTCTVQYLFESALDDCPDAIREPDDELITNDPDSDNDWTEEGHMTLEEAQGYRVGDSVMVIANKDDGYFEILGIRTAEDKIWFTLDYFGKEVEFYYKKLMMG